MVTCQILFFVYELSQLRLQLPIKVFQNQCKLGVIFIFLKKGLQFERPITISIFSSLNWCTVKQKKKKKNPVQRHKNETLSNFLSLESF